MLPQFAERQNRLEKYFRNLRRGKINMKNASAICGEVKQTGNMLPVNSL